MNVRYFNQTRSKGSLSRGALVSCLIATMLLAVSLTGCRLCNDSEDLAYPTYGGAWQRTIRDQGRVGSLFDPAGARASALVSRDTPIPADELERSRQEASATPKYSDEDEEPYKEPGESMDGENADSNEDSDVDSDGEEEDLESGLEKRKRKLRDKELEEIKVVPGDPLPPLLR